MLTAIVFILILGLLIFIHELGHFLTARFFGMKVEEFAFGFPPRILSKVKKGTRYSLNLIPIGGYVRILGEEGSNDSPGSFSKKPWQKRFTVVIAGVIMNIILSIVLMSIGFSFGMSPPVSTPQQVGGAQKPIILASQIIEDSPAFVAGLKAGDELISGKSGTNTTFFATSDEVKNFTKENAGKPVSLTIRKINARQSSQVNLTLSSGDAPLGVALSETAIVKLPILTAIRQGFIETGKTVVVIFAFLGTFFTNLFRGVVADEVTGVVGIYQFTGQAVGLGFGFVVQLAAMISVNLALINLLPIPALDGGRAVFILLEGIFKRKVVKEQYEGIIHTIGFILLILLMLAITARDIIRL